MSDLDEKIARLPAWVRQHIKHLESKPEILVQQCIKLRKDLEVSKKEVRRLEDMQEAMLAIFRAAERGENETAKAFVERMIDLYTNNDEG